MKKFVLTLTMALAVGGAGFRVATPAAQAAESSAQRAGRAAIVAAQKKADQAMVKADLGDLMFYFAPDFQLHTLGGQVYNRAQTEQVLQQTLSGAAVGIPLDYTKASTRILSLTWRGKDAIVMAENTALAVAQKGGRAIRLETVSLARDYWTPTAQGWKVRQSVERVGKMWLNGKRIR